MSTIPTPVASPQETNSARLRNIGLNALFALAYFLPKLLNLRRDRRSWLAFRVALALAGASLVILPLSLWNSWHAAIAGLVMFLAATLLPEAKPDTTLADTAARLGAHAVVNGGLYQAAVENGQFRNAQPQYQQRGSAQGEFPAAPVQLFVCPDRIWALDSHQHPLLIIPTSQISSAIASESANDWTVRVRWAERTADFHYRGIFAEHRAHVAASALRGVIQPALPVIPQKRAATA